MSRIIACIGSHPGSSALLRAARRMARAHGLSEFIALHIETPKGLREGGERARGVLRNLNQAQEMGAQLVQIEASDMIQGITDFLHARQEPETHVLIGQPRQKLFRLLWGFSSGARVVRHNHDFAVFHLVPLGDQNPGGIPWVEIFQLRPIKMWRLLYPFVGSFIALVAAELLGLILSEAHSEISLYNLSLIFLLPTVFLAGRYGLMVGLISAIINFLTLNYFYVEPRYKLDIANFTEAVNVSLFLATGVGVAIFGSYTYSYLEAIRRRERRARALFTLNDVASRALTRRDLLQALHEELTQLLETEVAIYTAGLMNPNEPECSWPPHMASVLNPQENAALIESWNRLRPTGAGTAHASELGWRFEPMTTGTSRVGVLGVQLPAGAPVDVSFGPFLAALALQVATILERLELFKSMEAQRIVEEKEKLRAMLLSSVSHDLKTPLSSIIGALSVYHGMYDALSEERRRSLTETAFDEAQRLNSFITNILDMTRIESGQVHFKQEWDNPEEMVQRVLRRMRQRLRQHTVEVHPLKAPILVRMDSLLTEQALQNLLENAAKYTPVETHIDISFDTANQFSLSVRDRGPGIPEDRRETIFDKYERIRRQDSMVAGTGLGLAITRAIMLGQGGSVVVENHKDGGAIFHLRLPDWRLQKQEAAHETA